MNTTEFQEHFPEPMGNSHRGKTTLYLRVAALLLFLGPDPKGVLADTIKFVMYPCAASATIVFSRCAGGSCPMPNPLTITFASATDTTTQISCNFCKTGPSTFCIYPNTSQGWYLQNWNWEDPNAGLTMSGIIPCFPVTLSNGTADTVAVTLQAAVSNLDAYLTCWSPTPTVTETPTPTETFTITPTHTFTETPSPTETPTITETPTFTDTITPTNSWTTTPTPTSSRTHTFTPTPSPTTTVTDTPTVTLTPTPPCVIHVWPNPYNPDKAFNGTLKMDCVMPGDTVAYYTLSGEWVNSIVSASTLVEWDGRNQNGRRVAEGLYYFTVRRGNSTVKVGKIFVLLSG